MYKYQPYPKMIYKDGEHKIVQDEAEHKACDGWSETPQPKKEKKKPGPKPKVKENA